MKEHPEATNKSLIARETGVNRSTVIRYFDSIRAKSKKGIRFKIVLQHKEGYKSHKRS